MQDVIGTVTIELDFRGKHKLKDAIKELNFLGNSINKYKKRVYYKLKLIFSNFVEPEILAIVAAYIRYWNHAGFSFVKVEITPDSSYMERCGFLNAVVPSHFTDIAYGTCSNLKELTMISMKDDVAKAGYIVDDIIKIVKEKYSVEKSIYSALNFCLWEVIDNIYNHALEKFEYNVILQNFPQRHMLTIAVVDKGVGIYNALVKTQGSEFSEITEKQALLRCIEKHVTNGNGKGNGLYFTNKFLENNTGELIIYSGRYCLWNNRGDIKVNPVPRWDGTIVVFKIMTNVSVNSDLVFDGNIPTTVEECDEQIGGLW